MSHLAFNYAAGLPTSTAQMVTGLPSGSPNLSLSAPSLSPVCSSEDGGRAVSPPLPGRLPICGGPVNLSDRPGLPPSLSPSDRLSHHNSSGGGGTSSGGGGIDPSQFLGGDHNSQAAAAAAAAGLSLAYPRLSSMGMAALGSMPSLSYASGDQNPYSSLSMENFYNPLTNPYSLKEGGGPDMSAWSSSGLAASAAGYYPYDTSSLAAYGYGGAYGLAATRKNVTRESTATLKAWLNEHKKNPYPTKGEKIMLAIISKMTLTQVSCWFANARRRLKKENKMTWEPKNGLNDEDVDVSDEEDNDTSFKEEKSRTVPDHEDQRASSWVVGPGELTPTPQDKDGVPLPPSKPRIWSMAELAVSKSSYVGCG